MKQTMCFLFGILFYFIILILVVFIGDQKERLDFQNRILKDKIENIIKKGTKKYHKNK